MHLNISEVKYAGEGGSAGRRCCERGAGAGWVPFQSSATPDNFIKGLNAHFAEHPDCLLPEAPRFPYETTDPEKTKQMNALVTAQLLKVSVERDIHASRFVTTPLGDRLAPRFAMVTA